jgi:hypothetical protein
MPTLFHKDAQRAALMHVKKDNYMTQLLEMQSPRLNYRNCDLPPLYQEYRSTQRGIKLAQTYTHTCTHVPAVDERINKSTHQAPYQSPCHQGPAERNMPVQSNESHGNTSLFAHRTEWQASSSGKPLHFDPSGPARQRGQKCPTNAATPCPKPNASTLCSCP